ncbi:MAG: ROK family protein, partial [Clostridia bacterium]|nr:ROK family protein [Clostridia bacterium]
MKIIGIDIGGTGVKGVIIDEKGEVFVKDSIPTEAEKGADNLVKNIAAMIENMLSASGISKSEVAGVGVGCPGLIDSR